MLKLIRAILLALLLSFLFGMAIGTWIRHRIDKPVRYLAACEATAPVESSGTPLSAPAPGPLHVAASRTHVGDPGQHEEQIG